ncbi:MAG: FHA domain-containing protein [Lentisphaeria bacterium]|nr:FHA domain-containing protein [Lentisphaeria bacterium]
MKLFFVNGLRAGEELEFAIPEITVGRELDNVVIIPVEGVSRYHGKFSLQSNGKWIVKDTGSTNGIKCNRLKIQGAYELHEGDLVEFGDQMIRVTGLNSSPAQVVFSLEDEDNGESGEIKITPPAPPVQDEIKITPPAPPVQDEIKITPPAPPVQDEIRTDPPQKLPQKQTAKEISEALKNGKLHLFGTKEASDPMRTQFGGEIPVENGNSKRKLRFSNKLYYTVIICLAVMGVTFFLKINQPPAPKTQSTANSTERDTRRFMLYYEKKIISPDNVFFFILHIENGEAKFKIDDLKSSRSFTRSKIPFTREAYERFLADLEHEHFFKAVSPEAAPDMGGRRDYRRLVICDKGRLHELTVRNNMRPSAFERLEDTINLFAENHALRTVAMTPEELREQAAMNFDKAEDLFQNRQSRPANLRDAIQRYRLTVEYLNAFVPKPVLWDKARKQLELAEKIRDDRLAALRSERIRLGQLREFSAVLPVLDEIMALSDQDSPTFSDARKMRIKVDSYLRKHGGRRK